MRSHCYFNTPYEEFPAAGQGIAPDPANPGLMKEVGTGGRHDVSLGSFVFPLCEPGPGGKTYDYWVKVCAWIDTNYCVPEYVERRSWRRRENTHCEYLKVHHPKPDLTPWRPNYYSGGYRDAPSNVELTTLSGGVYGDCTDVPVNNIPGRTQCTGIRAEIRNIGEGVADGVRAILFKEPGHYIIDGGIPLVFTIETGEVVEVLYDEWLPEDGIYWMDIFVDPNETIEEYDEDNNETDRDIPELEVRDIETN